MPPRRSAAAQCPQQHWSPLDCTRVGAALALWPELIPRDGGVGAACWVLDLGTGTVGAAWAGGFSRHLPTESPKSSPRRDAGRRPGRTPAGGSWPTPPTAQNGRFRRTCAEFAGGYCFIDSLPLRARVFSAADGAGLPLHNRRYSRMRPHKKRTHRPAAAASGPTGTRSDAALDAAPATTHSDTQLAHNAAAAAA